MMKGFIKDYRKELQSDIWVMPPLYHRVWQYLKYKANHKENKIPMTDGSFLTVKPGQHLTSIRTIANGVGWYERGVFKTPNPKTISSVLDWLEKQNMIKIDRGKGNRQYTLITLLNWDLYQMNDYKSNSKETVSKQSVDINNNDKNDKNLCSSNISDSEFSQVMQFYQSNLQRGLTETPFNLELLRKFYEDFGYDLLMAAMKVAAKSEAKGINFLESVLNNWREAGVKTIEEARRYEIEFKNRKSKTIPFRKKHKPEYDPNVDAF